MIDDALAEPLAARRRLHHHHEIEVRMKAGTALSLAAMLVASACESSTPPSAGAPPSVVAAQAGRDALVYAAVVRQLVARDHGFGGAASPYRRVYVLDGVVPDAADPMHPTDHPGARFAAGMARRIAAELGDLPPVRFVRSRRLVIRGHAAGHVIHRGVLITLGPIEWVDSRTANVGNSRWANGLNGQWLTYTITLRHSSWRVTGIAGSTATIS
jgi:hypothetical protein